MSEAKTSKSSTRTISFDTNDTPSLDDITVCIQDDEELLISGNHTENSSPNKSPQKQRKASVLTSLVSSVLTSVRKLKKTVGFPQGFALMVGIIIGSGIFVAPSLVVDEVNDVYTSLVIWLAAGIIAVLGSLCYCELGTTIKVAGGNYAYILFIYGPIPAFLCSWTQVFLIDPTILSVIALTLGNYVLQPFNEGLLEPNPWYPKAIGCFCILLIGVTNCLSVRASTALQSVFNVCQVSSILFLASLGVWKLSTGHTHNFEHLFNNATIDWSNIGAYGSAFFGALWAYNGWQSVGNVTEEMTNVEKNLFKTVITAVPFVIISYLLVNASLFTVLNEQQVSESSSVAIDFVQTIFGQKIAYIVPVLVCLSCYGSANGSTFSCTRISLAAGREGHMPELLGMIHRQRRTPIPAIIVTITISILMLIPDSNTLQILINFASVATWLLFLVVFPGLIYLRWKQPKLHRPFKVWLIVPAFMTLIALLLVILPFTSKPISSSIAVGIILLGLPFYYCFVFSAERHPNWLFKLRTGFTAVIKKQLNLVHCSS